MFGIILQSLLSKMFKLYAMFRAFSRTI